MNEGRTGNIIFTTHLCVFLTQSCIRHGMEGRKKLNMLFFQIYYVARILLETL